MKKLFLLLIPVLFLSFSCTEEVESEYGDFLAKDYSEVLFILNGEAESISAYGPSDGAMYQDVQLVGYTSSSEAWPNDLLYANGSLYVVNSGQNAIEQYDGDILDYKTDLYLENGFNPMVLCPLDSGKKAAIAGFEKDEVVLVDLVNMAKLSGFVSVYEVITDVQLDANSEIQVVTTDKNATGDNQARRTIGLAVSGTTLYAANVRYDRSILMTTISGDLAEYNGSTVSAPGHFREATISVFSLSSDNTDLTLVKEVNLQSLYASDSSGEEYFPGDGLNPQSLFVLNGKLHVICTGTNGGSARTYTSSEYIPEDWGYYEGDTVPGTNPDDGKILILNITDPANPSLEKVLDIGGSPSGYRYSADSVNNILYLSGVGGVQSYNYASETILHDSDNLILAGSDPSSDYYSHVLYHDGILYVSDWSHDKLNRISISSNGSSYDLLDAITCGDGPGALAYMTY